MKKIRIVAVCLIGILMAVGLIMLGCDEGMCSGKCRIDSNGNNAICSVGLHSCAGSDKCATWDDYYNKGSRIFLDGCDCN